MCDYLDIADSDPKNKDETNGKRVKVAPPKNKVWWSRRSVERKVASRGRTSAAWAKHEGWVFRLWIEFSHWIGASWKWKHFPRLEVWLGVAERRWRKRVQWWKGESGSDQFLFVAFKLQLFSADYSSTEAQIIPTRRFAWTKFGKAAAPNRYNNKSSLIYYDGFLFFFFFWLCFVLLPFLTKCTS